VIRELGEHTGATNVGGELDASRSKRA
jgi:hypothetical protein